MKFKIGFSAEEKKKNPAGEVQQETKTEVKPKPSLVDSFIKRICQKKI